MIGNSEGKKKKKKKSLPRMKRNPSHLKTQVPEGISGAIKATICMHPAKKPDALTTKVGLFAQLT